MNDTTQPTSQPLNTLVLGGTGKTGRRVVERLERCGVPVRVGSRSAQPPFDWDDPRRGRPRSHGIDAVYISYYPDLAAPGRRRPCGAQRGRGRPGVKRLVLLSGPGRGRGAGGRAGGAGRGRRLDDRALELVRAELQRGLPPESVLTARSCCRPRDVPEPFIDADDIADVAVAALTEDGHAGQLYELTGPRLLTFAEAVAEIAKATDRPITFVRVSPEEFEAAALAERRAAEFVELLSLPVHDRARRAQRPPDRRRAAGPRPRAQDFYDFAWDAAAAGAWDRGGRADEGRPDGLAHRGHHHHRPHRRCARRLCRCGHARSPWHRRPSVRRRHAAHQHRDPQRLVPDCLPGRSRLQRIAAVLHLAGRRPPGLPGSSPGSGCTS